MHIHIEFGGRFSSQHNFFLKRILIFCLGQTKDTCSEPTSLISCVFWISGYFRVGVAIVLQDAVLRNLKNWCSSKYWSQLWNVLEALCSSKVRPMRALNAHQKVLDSGKRLKSWMLKRIFSTCDSGSPVKTENPNHEKNRKTITESIFSYEYQTFCGSLRQYNQSNLILTQLYRCAKVK